MAGFMAGAGACSGSSHTIAFADRKPCHSATTVAAKLTVDLAPVVIHEVRLVGARCGDMRRAVEVLASGAVDPRPLIEARYPLERADEAMAHAGRRGALKVLIDAPSRG